MIYADTDFFLALLKDKDWLQKTAMKLLHDWRGKIWTSPATLIELLLLSSEFHLDPERLLIDALEISELRGGDPNVFLVAAHYIKEKGTTVFDSVHAASCGRGCKIISSDKVFDKLGLDRVPLEP